MLQGMPAPIDHSQKELSSLVSRVIVFSVAALAVIAAFAIAWRLGAFVPSRP